jgi:acetoin utilization protein AcuA
MNMAAIKIRLLRACPYVSMNEKLSKEEIVPTPTGDVLIRSFCHPDEINQYAFDSQFRVYDDYKSLFTRPESLAKSAALAGANVVLALVESKNIIGYGVLAYPDSGERWAELGPKIMMEIKAIEVCRTWRSLGIAPRILKRMLRHPDIEDKIIYMVGYSWTWDLAGTHMTAGQYREKLCDLFQSFGFQEYETNEPNVCLKPENLLMCRIGKNISRMVKDRFKWLRFGLSPWTWKVDTH